MDTLFLRVFGYFYGVVDHISKKTTPIDTSPNEITSFMYLDLKPKPDKY